MYLIFITFPNSLKIKLVLFFLFFFLFNFLICQDKLEDAAVINHCPHLSGVTQWALFLTPSGGTSEAPLLSSSWWLRNTTLKLCHAERMTSRSLSKGKEITAVLYTLAWKLYVSLLFIDKLPELVTWPPIELPGLLRNAIFLCNRMGLSEHTALPLPHFYSIV